MDVVSVARLLGRPDADLRRVLAEIIAEVHVPYLAQFRYRGSGLLKRAVWEQAWELQRAEDRTGRQLDIPVPTIYASADFAKLSYWQQRGKLDMSKERFISYRFAAAARGKPMPQVKEGMRKRQVAHPSREVDAKTPEFALGERERRRSGLVIHINLPVGAPMWVVSISLAGVLLIGLVFGLARLTRAALSHNACRTPRLVDG